MELSKLLQNDNLVEYLLNWVDLYINMIQQVNIFHNIFNLLS